MSVRIRLKRMGRKKRPFYRLVAIDSKKRRDGLEVERLGWYNPVVKDFSCNMDEERVLYWSFKFLYLNSLWTCRLLRIVTNSSAAEG